jgi:hypothetical protein
MKRLFFIPFLFVCFFACDSDDSQSNDLSGSWNLMSFQCCLFEPESFNQGDIIWSFNSNNTLDVTINTELIENSQLPIQENSSVSYSLTSNTVTLESIEYDYFFEDGLLYLTDDPEVDGPIIIFERR